MLLAGFHSSRKALVLNDVEPGYRQNNLTLEKLASILARSAAQPPPTEDVTPVIEADIHLPNIITFPYSRHSSYAELRDLVRVFKPVDIYPCTVTKADWHEGESTFS
jgi:DNA cross-link repair 1C protein